MKNNELTSFGFNDGNIRTMFDKEDNQHWFVLSDLLSRMGTTLSAGRAATIIKDGLCRDEQTENRGGGVINDHPIGRELDDFSNFVRELPLEDSLGRTQKTMIVSEPAATFLISRSNTEAGRLLNRFIHTEVLPQIRRTGRYAPSKRRQFVLDRKETCLDGLYTLLELTHTERVGLIRDLFMDRKFEVSELLSEKILSDLNYFPAKDVAKQGNYLKVSYFKENLMLAGLVDRDGYFTEEGRKYGRVNEFGDSEWRLDVLDYINDNFEVSCREY